MITLFDARSFYRKVTSAEYALVVGILMIAFGSWLNAQGGWVKDFAFNKTVVLPFLFKNYYTSGFIWYLVGIFDDIFGLILNVLGFLLLRKSGILSKFARFKKNIFVLPLIVYILLDIIAFINFNLYYSGSVSLNNYGLYWNIIQYFGMLPALFATDLAIIMSKSSTSLNYECMSN